MSCAAAWSAPSSALGRHPSRRGGRRRPCSSSSSSPVRPRAAAAGQQPEGGGAAGEAPRLVFADIELDEESHEVLKAGELISLSPTEFKLLRYLMSNPGRVLSKAQILDHVWNYDFNGEAGIVESYISYLRRKIDTGTDLDGKPVAPLIHTRRGVGYVLRLPPETA